MKIIKYVLLITISWLLSFCSSYNTIQKSLDNKDNILYISNNVEKKDNLIYIRHKNQIVGSMTIDEFKSLIHSSKQYNEVIKAEREKRVYVILRDNPWTLDLKGSIYTTYIYIVWKDKVGKQLKKLTVKITLDIPKEGKKMSKLRILYRDIAEFGFITSILTIILLIVI